MQGLSVLALLSATAVIVSVLTWNLGDIKAGSGFSTDDDSDNDEPQQTLMIPGPVPMLPSVRAAYAAPASSHMSPKFIETFGRTLEQVRALMNGGRGSQAFVLAGSGTLGWDVVVANLLETGDRALVVHTGYFSDSFSACLTAYGIEHDTVAAAQVGESVSEAALAAALSKHTYALVAMTHVDTSTGVLNDVEALASVVRQHAPHTLVAVDGVCATGAVPMDMDAWGIDAVFTASQKAIGLPPGLMIATFSARALKRIDARRSPPPVYFASIPRWMPIMQSYEKRRGAYFATPPVQAIAALHVALSALERAGHARVAERHRVQAARVRQTFLELGFAPVPVRDALAAPTMTAMYAPRGIAPQRLLGELRKRGVVIAGGLHKDIQARSVRVGHMGLAMLDGRATSKLREALHDTLAF